jgi:peroxin-12
MPPQTARPGVPPSYPQVFSQRHPWLHRLLACEDEVFAALVLLLDGHSLLKGTDGTFADSLYGLRRRPLREQGPSSSLRNQPSSLNNQQLRAAGPGNGLSRRQRWLVLAVSVLLPYLRAKAERAYKAASQAESLRRPPGVLGLALRYNAARVRKGLVSRPQRQATAACCARALCLLLLRLRPFR